MPLNHANRLFSIDVFRGLTMFLLIAEAAGFHHNFFCLWDFTSLCLQWRTGLGIVECVGATGFYDSNCLCNNGVST